MSQEIELKLALGLDGPATLRDHPRLAGLTPQRARLENTYFDTPEGTLETAGMALRLRHDGEGLRQTLKTRGQGGGGLSRRGEWEWAVPGPGLDLPGLADLPPLADWPPERLERLAPRFATDFARETWHLEDAGSRIELVLDLGTIRSGERDAPIREIELELEAGSPEALWSLAGILAETLALRPSETSKAARGEALLSGWRLPAGDTPRACLGRALVALDALADTGDDRWRDAARVAFHRLAETGDDADSQAATDLAAALAGPGWLTPVLGRRLLALARRLPGEAELA